MAEITQHVWNDPAEKEKNQCSMKKDVLKDSVWTGLGASEGSETQKLVSYMSPLSRSSFQCIVVKSQKLSDRKGHNHPSLYGLKAKDTDWFQVRNRNLAITQYLLHGIWWTKNPTAAAAGAGWGICRAPRGGPTARGLYCKDLFIRKAQLVKKLLIFIHCQL